MTESPQFVVNVEAAVYRPPSEAAAGADADTGAVGDAGGGADAGNEADTEVEADVGAMAGEFLLAERSAEEDHAAGLLSLVGGTVEIDEPTADVLEETVRRELDEEVGVAVDRLTYLSSGAFQADTGEAVVNVVFLAEYADGEARAREPEEVAAVHWLSLDDATDRDDLPEFTENYLEQAQARVDELDW